MNGFNDFLLSIPNEAHAILVLLFVMVLGAAIGVICWRSGRRYGNKEADASWDWKFRHTPQVVGQEIVQKLELKLARAEGRAEILQERLREYVPIFHTAALQMKKLADETEQRASEE